MDNVRSGAMGVLGAIAAYLVAVPDVLATLAALAAGNLDILIGLVATFAYRIAPRTNIPTATLEDAVFVLAVLSFLYGTVRLGRRVSRQVQK